MNQNIFTNNVSDVESDRGELSSRNRDRSINKENEMSN